MEDGIKELRGLLVDNVLQPIAILVFAVGLLVFVFGVVEFLYGLNAETDARERGKRHMIWGLVGMFIMFVASSIVFLIIEMVGVDIQKIK
jgi:hypothetical protein